MHTSIIPDEIRKNYKYAIEQARKDRPRYLAWIQNEIDSAIKLINNFDKLYVLGALGAKLIKVSPTMYNQFLEGYEGPDKEHIEDDKIQEDDAIETLLEYAMSVATASPNANRNVIPTAKDIDAIIEQVHKIKINMNFWEMSADTPADGNEFDHWLRTNIMLDSINVRGDGYHVHIHEIYSEVFQPHDGFLEQYYGFNSQDVYETILKLDSLVYSKIGNPFGATQSHKRLTEWMDEVGQEVITNKMMETGKHFIMQFTEANPDLYDAAAPEQVVRHSLDRIESYGKIFWVIPKTEKEKRIFELLSMAYGDNGLFFQPEKFKAFPLNNTLINRTPLIKEDGKYYHFSLTLAFRNIFKITEELLKKADAVYYEHSFKNNSSFNSRDNYIERKTKGLFEKLLPNVQFYHSLEYTYNHNGEDRKTELDILGLSGDTIYIIEVKAGELNAKHRRGALKGLKDRLEETINEGSYQCHRALKYIQENENPNFEYIELGLRKKLVINKAPITSFFKISITLEHFGSIAANLKYLINMGVLSADFKWTWIVSIYDLMIFADLIQTESDFKEYLTNRIGLYERNDLEFSDEIDILGFYFDNRFPLDAEKENEQLHIVNYKDEIEDYYNKIGVGMFGIIKPKKKPK